MSKAAYRYYVVIDFECTCMKVRSQRFKNEIIEFPAVLVDAETLEIVDEFRRFVMPTENPVLDRFCTDLTGIQQSDIEGADTLDVVLAYFDEWLRENDVLDSFAFVTDGPWDFISFLYAECLRKGYYKRPYFDEWVNLRWEFAAYFKLKKRKNLKRMLTHFNLEFEGRLHSGIDDSRNIARIAIEMLKKGSRLKINESITNPMSSIHKLTYQNL
eukprot:TRINITY_DN7902_c0_g1_i1.p1 TRINITY_DN7902_c0_g1~~TRINITY_DN7902_c0_g1_i1.p1  ORF type:complete len:214 (-),score=37.69 TRINITY_DN7902_c0_g1_i1:17-658(-)